MNLTAIIIISVICWTILELSGKGKRSKKSQPDVEQQNSELQRQVSSLQERIAVLEAIVTDDKYSLKREFDHLSKQKAA